MRSEATIQDYLDTREKNEVIDVEMGPEVPEALLRLAELTREFNDHKKEVARNTSRVASDKTAQRSHVGMKRTTIDEFELSAITQRFFGEFLYRNRISPCCNVKRCNARCGKQSLASSRCLGKISNSRGED